MSRLRVFAHNFYMSEDELDHLREILVHAQEEPRRFPRLQRLFYKVVAVFFTKRKKANSVQLEKDSDHKNAA